MKQFSIIIVKFLLIFRVIMSFEADEKGKDN